MNTKTLLLVVILLAMVAYGGYYLGNKKTSSLSPAPMPSVSPTVTPTPDESVGLLAAIKKGLISEHGASAGSLKITVSKISGNYAQGGAVDEEGIGGAMWLAVKENGVWKLVWDGNGTISCDLTTQYPQFPVSMIPECWNEQTLKSVKR
jgi:hypothetical protein